MADGGEGRRSGVRGAAAPLAHPGPSMPRRMLLSLRVDGLVPTLTRLRHHLYGNEERYVFLQPVAEPAAPVADRVETKGLVLRPMIEADLADPGVQQHEPHEIGVLGEAVVATRKGRIVGAAWFCDSVGPEQPWYAAVEPHLIQPAWFDANIFVAPDEKAAAWALTKYGTERVAAAGVRSMVSLVSVANKPSILLLRLQGAKLVATFKQRHRWGRTSSTVEPVSSDDRAELGRNNA